MLRPKILVADSEEMFAEAVAYVLEEAGFEAVAVHDSRLALDTARAMQPDLCILGAGLPSISRFQLCCDLRKSEGGALDAPILFLGTDLHEETRIALLECGVDDYLAKPFGMREFMARVYALLRRAQVPLSRLPEAKLQVGKFLLDTAQRMLNVEENGVMRSIDVTGRECEILHLLMTQNGAIVARQAIMERIWGADKAKKVAGNLLDTHFHALRQKIEADVDNPQHLVSIRGVGFRFQP